MLSVQRTLLLLSILAVLMSAAGAQQLTKPRKNKTFAAASPVSGSGNVGQIAKWTGVDGSNTYFIGNSNIFEDKFDGDADAGFMVLHHAATFPVSTVITVHCTGYRVVATGRAVLTSLKVDSLDLDNH